MALGRAAKQTYFGRVIHPAQERQTRDGKVFLTFTLYVDRLVKTKEGEYESGKIYCSYSPTGSPDTVGIILCNIFNKDEADQGGLAGTQYKTVEVMVEGTPRLSQVAVGSDIVQNAYYINLDFVSVTITDNQVLALFKEEFTDTEAPKAKSATKSSKIEQPTLAPSKKKKIVLSVPAEEEDEEVETAKAVKPVESESETEAEEDEEVQEEAAGGAFNYKVGDIIEHNGASYKFKGGDPGEITNWVKVEQEESIPPFLKKKQKQVVTKPIVTPKKIVTKASAGAGSKKAITIKQIMDDPGFDDSSPLDEENEVNL